jgi:hypothetical protein
VDNPVYHRYIATSCFQQFGQIITPYLSVTIPMRPESPSTPRSASRSSPLSRSTSRARNILTSNSASSRFLLSTPPSKEETSSEQQQQQVMGFRDFVHILLKYRSEMNHFHLILKWIIDVFNQLVPSTSNNGFLSQAHFVQALICYSQSSNDRELENIFNNSLKQRSIRHLMPANVFVSVVLVLLRNDILSAICYRPLRANHTNESKGRKEGKGGKIARRGDEIKPSGMSVHEESEWMILARKWKAKEREFEKFVEEKGEKAIALKLLQLRTELYELLLHRYDIENRHKAQAIYEVIANILEGKTHEPLLLLPFMENNLMEERR